MAFQGAQCGDIFQCSLSHMGTPVSMADLFALYCNNWEVNTIDIVYASDSPCLREHSIAIWMIQNPPLSQKMQNFKNCM